ncbi:MAG TPA: hypothetical protein DCE39_11430, partial [Planctomycetaceae bacterium]|nr:hypothetical protein [Planctomycetaceae bacterium]
MNRWLTCLFGVAVTGVAVVVWSAEPGQPRETRKPPATKRVAKPVPLNPQGTVLLDRAGKRLLLKASVCARDRVLEMLCCLKRTKEHESILTIDASAAVVHAGLLALGARQGTPV